MDVNKLGVWDDTEPDGDGFHSDGSDMENDELELGLDDVMEEGCPVSPSRNRGTESERTELTIFLDLISKLTDDVRDLSVKLADSR